ncbi:MAG: hypothetical protein U0807_01500 [Candidatus Binatia bacterium]
MADRLREMALAGAGWAEEERVFALGDEAAGRELEDERPVELLVEVEIEGVEGLVGIAEARGGFNRAVILAPDELIADERGDEIEWREALGLRDSGAALRTSAIPEEAAGAGGGRDRVRAASFRSLLRRGTIEEIAVRN